MSQDKFIKNPTFKRNYCAGAALAELLNAPQGTIESYTEMGIFPYLQLGERLVRYYHKKRARKRLEEIFKLEKQGKTVEQLQRIYHKDVREHRTNKGLKAWG